MQPHTWLALGENEIGRFLVMHRTEVHACSGRKGSWGGPAGMGKCRVRARAHPPRPGHPSSSPSHIRLLQVCKGEYVITKSHSGYTAYTPNGPPSSGSYIQHGGTYCGEGNSTHAPTVYEGGGSFDQCKDKCMQMSCTCFDVRQSGGGGGGGIGGGIGGSGPLVLFQQNLSASLVISAYSNFMAHSQTLSDDGHGRPPFKKKTGADLDFDTF